MPVRRPGGGPAARGRHSFLPGCRADSGSWQRGLHRPSGRYAGRANQRWRLSSA